MKSSKELEYLVDNLSMLVGSGMPILLALTAIHTELRSKNMRRVVQILREEIESGSPIWKALDKTRIFPSRTVSLIRIGEETGKLPQNLKLIALQEEKERIFKSRVRSAFMYPVLVLSLTLTIGIGVAWFVLPRLVTVFSRLQMELPITTKGLIAVGSFIKSYGIIALPIFSAIIFVIIYFTFFFPKTKSFGQALLFSLPVVGRLIQEIELARLGYLLGTLLEAGLPIIQSLDSLIEATTSLQYKKLYIHIRTKIDEGESFQKSFALYHKVNRFIPATVQQMISTGEQSGNLSGILLNIGRIFENKIETTTKNLTVILEPVLLIIVGVGVLTVALAIILPIYSLIGGFAL